ncbi:MAG: TRL domain-containing protein [Planctomycetota bacterium]
MEHAARNGGLTKVHYADYEILEILGIFGQFTVRAYGE